MEASINLLGDSLLVNILFYSLEPPFQLEPRYVCRKWYRLSKEKTLWKAFFRRDFGEVHSDRWDVSEWGGLRSGRIQWENLYFRHFRWTNRPLGVVDLSRNLLKPSNSSLTNTSKVSQILNETSSYPSGTSSDSSSPFRLVTILDSRIFTCFSNSPIQVWCLNDGQYLGELFLPDDTLKVTTLACSEVDHIIAIGDLSGKIILYRRIKSTNKRKFHQEHKKTIGVEYWGTIQSDDISISALYIFRGHLATLSSQGTLSLFKLGQENSKVVGQKIFTTTNGVPSQSPVAMTLRPGHSSKTILLMVAFDIKLYDGTHIVAVQEFTFESSQLTLTRYLDVSAHDTERATSPITCLAFGGLSQALHLVTGHSDHTVHVWLVSHDITHISTLFGHTGAIRCVAIDDLQPVRVISGSHDRRVKVWSLPVVSHPSSNKVRHSLLMTLDAHSTPIATLATKQDLRLVSGDVAGTWKLWTFDS